MCKEFGIVSRNQGTARKKKKERIIQNTPIASPYDEFILWMDLISSPNINSLCEFFPQYSKECLASVYWDTEKNVEKTVNRIVGKNGSVGAARSER